MREPGAPGMTAAFDPAAAQPALLDIVFNRGIVRRSFCIALIVGTVLNLIAQGDFLVDGLPLNFWKIAMTFCVPYCVATYGAVTARLETYRRLRGATR
ncbi:MAG: nitrate/nitrite transporter NrtS [Candidatus Eiseniibacteriota bacterium]